MWNTCMHVLHMTKMIQIRHVPEALHRRLRARAALAGMSLSDYLRNEIEVVAGRLTPEELRTRLRALTPVVVSESPAEVLRAERDAR